MSFKSPNFFLSCLISLLVLGGCDRASKAPESSSTTRITRKDSPSAAKAKESTGGDSSTKTVSSGTSEKSGEDDKATQSEDSGSTYPRLTIFGKVSRQDGSPVAGAKIRMSNFTPYNLFSSDNDENVESTFSSADGEYELSTTGTQYRTLQVSADGMGNAVLSALPPKEMQKAAKTRRVRRDIVMQPGSFIRGKIVDDRDQPVSNTTVGVIMDTSKITRGDEDRVYPDSQVTTSGADGSFALENLLAADFQLSADSALHVPHFQDVTAPAENLVIRLQSGGGSVSGAVLMLHGQEPVSSATVTLSIVKEHRHVLPRRSFTDQSGRFQFDRLPAGPVLLTATKEKLKQIDGHNGLTFELGDRETTNGVELRLYGGHTLTGIVTNHETQEPIEGVEVGPVWGGDVPKGTTDSNGRYRIENIFSKNFAIRPDKKGFKPYKKERYGSSEVQVTLPVDTLEVEQNLEMVPTLTVSGRVLMENGKTVSGAEIKPFIRDNYENNPKKIETNALGIYEVEVAPFSLLRIKSFVTGFPPAYSELIEVNDTPVSASDILMKAGGTIEGMVVDSKGQAVEGASITSWVMVRVGSNSHSDSLGETAISAADGKFLVDMVPEGQINVTARKKGHAQSKSENVTMGLQENKTGLVLKLQDAFTISGKVTDKSGKALEGVWVNAHMQQGNGGSGSGRTDKEGNYKLEDLGAGKYQVSASGSAGYANKQGIEAGSQNVDFVLGRSDSQGDEPKGDGVFIGKVLDWSTKQPITNFKATLEQYSGSKVELDEAQPGKFFVRNLRTRYGFHIRITAPGYLEVYTDTLSVQDPSKPTEMEFLMGPGGIVSGRAVERGTGKTLEGVRVLLLGIGNEWDIDRKSPEKSVMTGPDGTFSFDKVGQGTNWLSFRPTSPLVRSDKSIAVEHGKVADLGDVELGTGAVLKGKLISVPGDEPIADAEVVATSNSGGFSKLGKTVADGTFEIASLPAGQYSIGVSAYGINSWFQIKEGETKEVLLKAGTGTLNGTILKGTTPQPETQVSLSLQGDSSSASSNVSQSKHAQADADGKFQMTKMAPGLWKGQLMPMIITEGGGRSYGQSQVPIEVTITEGEVSQTFTLPSGSISGQVVDMAGQPVPNISLAVTYPKGVQMSYYGERRTKPDGSFLIEGLPAGEYQISARHKDRGYASVKVPLSENAEVKDIILRLEKGTGGTLISTVLNMEGTPIKEAWCYLDGPGGRYNHGATRDAQGVMTITDIPPGQYSMEVSYWSHSESRRVVDIKKGETVRFDDVLYPAGALRWTILDANGGALKNIECTLVPKDPSSIEPPRQGTTDQTGTWVVRGMGAGTYTGTAKTSDGKSVTADIQIQNGQPTALSTTLK